MATVYPLTYAPYLDTNWAANPGACTAMEFLVPMQNGHLQGVDKDNTGFALTGSDHLHAEIFTQTSGSGRFLTFRVQNIDEYSTGGVRTNRGTGYNASTSDWSVTAVGNQIIACNYLDAIQSSTGAGFSAIGGGAPKARRIASNVNFVMLADVDDGGSNVFADMVWWSGIRNPNTYTPSQATQAGRVRLLDAPGPIKDVVSYGDKFVAFKENSIFVGQYIGPPYVFSWRLITNTIGLSYPKAVTECDGRLYFAHVSGVYSFDGQQIRNIGQGVWAPAESYSTADPIKMRADDLQGNVFIGVHAAVVSGGTTYWLYVYAYNVRTGIWTRIGNICVGDTGAPQQPIVYGTTSEYRSFISTWAVFTGFAWIDNAASAKVAFLTGGSVLNDSAATFTTGKIGLNDEVGVVTRVYPRFVGTLTNLVSTAYVFGYKDESASSTGSATLSWNTNIGSLDGMLAAKYKSVALTSGTGVIIDMAGIGMDGFSAGKR